MAEERGQLHQLLAVLPNLKGTAEKAKGAAGKSFGSPHLFQGFVKAYHPKTEEEVYLAETLAEEKPLTETVGQVLSKLAEGMGPWIDAEYQRDKTNSMACADLTIGDDTFGPVPATFLLQLKKNLADLKRVYEGIPVLDLKVKWEAAADQGHGVFISPVTFSVRTQKTNVHKTVQEPTEHHPAQVVAWTEDVPVGKFEIRHLSGMITPAEKARVLSRIEGAINMVTKALAEANQVSHSGDKIADSIFEYINGELTKE